MENTTKQNKQIVDDFTEIVKPLIKYMAENYNPHTTLIITSTNAELLEGKMSTGKILDFIG